MSEKTEALRAAVHAAITDELNAHRHGSIADQQTARQALWDARHALEVAHLEDRVDYLDKRAQQSGYAQDCQDWADAVDRLKRLKASKRI
jgi:hypothetical protein